ncbi:MAG: class I SAM-dependent methyltransferase [Desulfomonilia bacterium]
MTIRESRTFAFRQPLWAASLRIFEVDHPDTQQQKQSKISNAGIAIPGNVVFVRGNFEKESIEECLTSVVLQ